MNALSTLDLVIEARKGNREAFDALTVRFWARCKRIAWLYLRNSHEAEDEAQNALVEAYLHIERCDATKFRSWLDKIVQNQCLMNHREKRCRPGRFYYLHNRPYARLLSRELNPEKKFERSQLTDLVSAATARLPKIWREVIELHRLRELEINEVARMLGIHVHAAKSRLIRAQSALRDRLERSHVSI